MRFAIYDTHYGKFRITYNTRAITAISFFDVEDTSQSQTSELSDMAFTQLQEFFVGSRTEFDLPIEFSIGTDFQRRVWRALLNIPYAQTRSYKDIAIEVGSPLACRAVGMANNRNPIAIVVPCHRVIGASGRLVGYGGGLDIKESLLELERSIAKSKL